MGREQSADVSGNFASYTEGSEIIVNSGSYIISSMSAHSLS